MKTKTYHSSSVIKWGKLSPAVQRHFRRFALWPLRREGRLVKVEGPRPRLSRALAGNSSGGQQADAEARNHRAASSFFWQRVGRCRRGGVYGLCLLLAGCQVSRGGYESAPYTVVQSEGVYEVRDYPELTVVETRMTSGSGEEGDKGFMRLFRFISGANEGEKKIAMTTPVFMTGSDTSGTMAFVMPSGMATTEVPKPTDPSVSVRKLPAGRFAVLRFRGVRSEKNEAESLSQLKSWMEAQKLPVLSSPVYGYFDPPWTPPSLRRNEVMLRTEPGQPQAN